MANEESTAPKHRGEHQWLKKWSKIGVPWGYNIKLECHGQCHLHYPWQFEVEKLYVPKEE